MTLLPLHVLAGGMGLISGYVALSAAKGGTPLSGSGPALSFGTAARPERFPLFIFGVVGLLAAAGDMRMIRAGGIQGPRRIARHLWRMSLAMVMLYWLWRVRIRKTFLASVASAHVR